MFTKTETGLSNSGDGGLSTAHSSSARDFTSARHEERVPDREALEIMKEGKWLSPEAAQKLANESQGKALFLVRSDRIQYSAGAFGEFYEEVRVKVVPADKREVFEDLLKLSRNELKELGVLTTEKEVWGAKNHKKGGHGSVTDHNYSYAIEDHAPTAERVIPELIERLKDKDNPYRYLAALSLGYNSELCREIRSNPLFKEAISELKAALKDPDTHVRSAAQSALERIQ